MTATSITMTIDARDLVTADLDWVPNTTGPIFTDHYRIVMLMDDTRFIIQMPDDKRALAGMAEALRHVVAQLDAEVNPPVRVTVIDEPETCSVTTAETRASVLSALDEPPGGMEVHADEPGGED